MSWTGDMESAPLVSVIMPVYNGEAHLRESIDSILAQSLEDFEFIILNDGSTDNSEAIILSYKDHRIRYARHKNCGLAATLNVGLALSTGKYIARQDQDDISYKERLLKQVDYLERNENVILLGTWANILFEGSEESRLHDHATNTAVLRFDLMFDNPFVHSSVMFRKKEASMIGNYNTDRNCYEDFELWSRFAAWGDVANLGEVLLDYRHHEKGMSKDPSYAKNAAGYRQSLKNIETFLGRSGKDIVDLVALYHWHDERRMGASLAEIMAVLDEIADKISVQQPQHAAEVKRRLGQYRKIIAYRVNKLKRKGLKKNSLKMFLLRVESRLKGLHPNVINR